MAAVDGHFHTTDVWELAQRNETASGRLLNFDFAAQGPVTPGTSLIDGLRDGAAAAARTGAGSGLLLGATLGIGA